MASFPSAALSIKTPNPLDEYAKALSVKNLIGQGQEQQQTIQSNALAIQQQQQALKDQQAQTASMTQWDGKDISELPALILKNGGSANAVFAARKQILDQKEALSKIAADDATTGAKNMDTLKAKNDQISGQLESLLSQSDGKNYDIADTELPVEAKRTVNSLLTSGLIDPDHAQALSGVIDANANNPTQLRQQIDHYGKTFMGASQIADWAQKNAATQKDVADQFKEIPGTGTFWNPVTNQIKSPAGQVLSPQMAESKFLQIDQARKLGNPVSKEDEAFAGAYRDMKTMVPAFNFNMQSNALQDNALDMAAKNYLITGQMPTGLRSPGMSSAIINRAGQLASTDPGFSNIAANKAAYNANKVSLDSLQKNFDQVNAFENTAGKNLDLFLGTAKNVIDSGSPWVNTPLRSVAQQGLGSADMAAYNAARQTALTEIAKVLNSSNATGVLSDSARGEVSQLIGPNASLKQVYAAANILKQDMDNRHDAYQQQIGDIKSRFNFSPSETTPAAGGAKFTAPAGAPSAQGVPDGHQLKQGGQVIAVARGGQWVAPSQ